MKRITHYLLRTLLLAMIVVTLAVTAAVWLTQSLRYVDVVVENGAPLHMFVWLALLTLPVFLSLALPIALFVAILFTYNRFTQDAELIAMRACGMSPRALARPAIILALVSVGICYALTLWIQPAARRELKQMQYFVQSQFSAALLREGTFNDLGNRMTVYVAQRHHNAELTGILIYDGRNVAKPMTIRAARGQLVQGERVPQVVVHDGIQQEYNRETHQLSELTFDSYAVSLDSLIPEKSPRASSPGEYTTSALIQEVLSPSAQNGDDSAKRQQRFARELHQRLVTPLLALAFALIASLGLLTGAFNRRGQAKRIAGAVILAALLQAAAMGLSQIAGSSALLALPFYLIVLAPIVLGLLALIRSGQITAHEAAVFKALRTIKDEQTASVPESGRR